MLCQIKGLTALMLVPILMLACGGPAHSITIDGSPDQLGRLEERQILINLDISEKALEQKKALDEFRWSRGGARHLLWEGSVVVVDLTRASGDCNVDLKTDANGDGEGELDGEDGLTAIEPGQVTTYSSLSKDSWLSIGVGCTGAVLTMDP